jgi:hypothetical protein
MMTIRSARQSTLRVLRAKNMVMISTALTYYEHDHGSLPPAHTVDRQGRPLHSWRVLILPYLGQEELYSLIKLDEPWDSPSNRRLLHRMPEYYGYPSEADGDDRTETCCLAVVGPHEPWGIKGRNLSDFGDPRTIMVIQIPTSDTPWMEPRDLTPEQALDALRRRNDGGCGSDRSTAIEYLTIGGEVRTLDANSREESLRRLLPNGL